MNFRRITGIFKILGLGQSKIGIVHSSWEGETEAFSFMSLFASLKSITDQPGSENAKRKKSVSIVNGVEMECPTLKERNYAC